MNLRLGHPRAGATALLLVVFLGCARQGNHLPDASQPAAALTPDAGSRLTAAKVEAWLGWHRALKGLHAGDAGLGTRADLLARAKAERDLAADAGLTLSDVDQVEAVVSVFVAERSVERLSGAAALTQFKSALEELSAEQRVKAEAALHEVTAKAAPSPLPALTTRYGADVVEVLLAHEADLTALWDSLLEAR